MAFEGLKEKQSAMWGSAPFENVTGPLAPMHDDLVAHLAPVPGERLLDLGCGTGEIAFRAARLGADVVGADLAPALIETAQRQAAGQGLEISFETADCENLPYADGSFDVIGSSVGVIFAPDHAAVAAELARVCRPGGRIGLSAWRQSSGVGQMFQAMAPFQPPPPEGVGSPFQWGDEGYAAERLGGDFELMFGEGNAPDIGETGAEMWQSFVDNYGPSHTLANSLDADRRAELDAAMTAFYEGFREGDGIRQPRVYILILGERR